MTNSVFHPTLYTPATTPVDKQLKILNGEREGEGIWRVVLCTEDSIREGDVPLALDTLRTVLHQTKRHSGVGAFVRVRNADVMKRVLDLPDADKLKGFVIPKADPESLPDYVTQLAGTDFKLMPILESQRMFDRSFRTSLLHVLLGYNPAIECLRIGANDLMGYLGIRRPTKKLTVYDTPIGNLIGDIITEYRGVGDFTITAPVFECFGPEYDGLLRKEVTRNITYNLYGQTVIHPRHIRMIRDMYKVSKADLESAQKIMGDAPKAVEGLNGRMDEYTTHWRWAKIILERYALFGDSETSKTGAHVL